MRSLEFRVYDNAEKCYSDKAFSIDQLGICYVQDEDCYWEEIDEERYIIEQYTGLKDKNGKEIYEYCELDGRYIVEYIAPSFVGRDIINGDIIELYDNKFTITKERCEIPQNSERSIN